jgi:hypothetical protein
LGKQDRDSWITGQEQAAAKKTERQGILLNSYSDSSIAAPGRMAILDT